MQFPAAVAEIPVASIDAAAAYYTGKLGFTLEWGDEAGGIAGLGRGDCRLFLTSRGFREVLGNLGPVVIWVNLGSRDEVDSLFAEWRAAGAILISAPEDKAWKLREFVAGDRDGNRIRVFFDFHLEAMPTEA